MLSNRISLNQERSVIERSIFIKRKSNKLSVNLMNDNIQTYMYTIKNIEM